MRIILQPVFVLHSRPFRDTSLLLDLLTHHHGRIHVLARNARGLRSRFKGLLQPFVPFLASWSGKTELMYLNQVEANGLPYYLSGVALISGFYLNELLVRLLHREDAHPAIYTAYQTALSHLARGDNQENLLRLFEKQLLFELGYGVQLDKDATGVPIIAEQLYQYQAQHGFVKTFRAISEATVFQGKNLLALHYEELRHADDLQAAKRLMRLLLIPLLGDKPIKSRELFIKIEN